MKNKLSLFLFILYFLFFVLSNSIFVSNNDDAQLESTSFVYWLRHGIIILISFFSFLYFKKKHFYFIISLFLISLIYFIGNQIILGLMTISLSFSSIVIGNSFINIFQKNKQVLLIFLFISILPLVLNFNEILSNGIFSSKYGRDRMLLGFFHPKEAAQPFLFLFILYYILFRKYRTLIFISGMILLYFIGSRNAFLFFGIFVFLTSNFKYKYLIILLFIFSILSYIVIHFNDLLYLIDEFSSDRISAWKDVMQYQNDSSDQFKADSFYIEIFVKSGLFGLIIFFIWFMQFLIVWKPFIGFFKPLSIGVSLVCSLLIYSMIDSGISSTGNLVHVFTWSFFSSFANKKLIHYNI